MVMPEDWAPEACTLPSAEHPLRVAEFDVLFTAVLRFDRSHPTRLDLVLPLDAAAAARDLADRECRCCSFFSFDFERVGDDIVMRIEVPPSQVDVLDAIEARVAR